MQCTWYPISNVRFGLAFFRGRAADVVLAAPVADRARVGQGTGVPARGL
jgi:hypothetical protein